MVAGSHRGRHPLPALERGEQGVEAVTAVQPPIRLCCGQSHNGAVCPDGTFMCCLCFDKVILASAYEDAEGRWDMCRPCGEGNA